MTLEKIKVFPRIIETHILSMPPCIQKITPQNVNINIFVLRGAFGKYIAQTFFSVTDKQTHKIYVQFGIILNSYLSSMSGGKFHYNVVM